MHLSSTASGRTIVFLRAFALFAMLVSKSEGIMGGFPSIIWRRAMKIALQDTKLPSLYQTFWQTQPRTVPCDYLAFPNVFVPKNCSQTGQIEHNRYSSLCFSVTYWINLWRSNSIISELFVAQTGLYRNLRLSDERSRL